MKRVQLHGIDDVRLLMAEELRVSGSMGHGDSFPEALAAARNPAISVKVLVKP